jgi:DNA helicase HerA-like ATPase
MLERAATMGLTLNPSAPPVVFWDLFGQKGHPIRTTISEMGPVLLSRLLELNDVQEGVLTVVFHVADQDGLLLLDLKDLQAALKYVADHAAEIGTQYGNVSPATVGAIQRKLLTLQSQGAENFFGEPALKLADLMRVRRGRSRLRQPAGGRQADPVARALFDTSCCGCCRSCSRNCPRWAIRRSPSWCSSSTRPTCCSTTRPSRCWRRSSRSCG